jgi:D-serine deaminase-like pyridoxal phosphate-dependent protein
MKRAGVLPGAPAFALAQRIVGTRGLRVEGVMAWEAHATRMADPAEKKRTVEQAVEALVVTDEQVRAAGIPVAIVSCGGTGTYWITAKLPGVTEVQAGGGIFCDVHYRRDYGVQHECALTILTTVLSRPTASRIICDAGWKAMASYPTLPEPLDVGEVKTLHLSAEHATIELTPPQSALQVGDRVEFIAGYSDSTVFLHDYLYGVRAGHLEVIWPILGRGKTQ